MDSVTTASGNISLGDWQALVILIPYILVPVLLLVGVILAWLNIDVPRVRGLLTWLGVSHFHFPCCLCLLPRQWDFNGGQCQCRFLLGWQATVARPNSHGNLL